MTIYLRFLISLALALSLSPSAGAASLPYVDFGGGQAQPETIEKFELTELQGHWWRYFEVEGETLERHIREAIDRLEALRAELPPRTVQNTHTLATQIRNNLTALPAARAEAGMALPAPVEYQTHYTVTDLLGFANRLRALGHELEATRYNVAAADGVIKLGHERNDSLMAEYLTLARGSPERVLKALEIIADRSEIALAEEKLRVHQAALRAHEASFRQIDAEIEIAAERLDAEFADFERLNQGLVVASEALLEARETLRKAQAEVAEARALSIVKAGAEGQAVLLYRNQQALHAAVGEAAAEVSLYKLQAHRLLVLLLLELGEIDTRTLREQVAAFRKPMATIRTRLGTWRQDSARERDLAGEALAGTSDEVAAQTLLRLQQDRLDLAQRTLVALQRVEDSLALTGLLVAQIDRQLAQREGPLRAWLIDLQQTLQQFLESTAGWIDKSLFKVGDTPVTAEGLMRVALILIVAWVLSHWLRYVLRRIARKREGVSQSALYTVGRLSHYAIITLGLFIGLSSIGVDFTHLALVAGAIGIGVGFGLQSIVANFVAGLILLFERSLKVGDFVQLVSGVTGEVRSINVRSTVITTNDNVDVVVPNSQFITNDMINWTLHDDYCRIHVPFKVAYGTDKELVKTAILEAANRLPHTLKTRRPGVWLAEFDDDAMAFELVVWITPAAVKRPGAVNAEYRWEIETALRERGIEIPVPQRDLRLRSDVKELLKVLLSKEAA